MPTPTPEADAAGETAVDASAAGPASGSTAATGRATAAPTSSASTTAPSGRARRSGAGSRRRRRAGGMPGPYRTRARADHGPGGLPACGGGTSGGVRWGTVRSVIRVYLGHGASGTAASMKPWVDGLRGPRHRGARRGAAEAQGGGRGRRVRGAGARRAGHRHRRPLVRRPGRVARGRGRARRGRGPACPPVRGARLPVLPDAPARQARERRPRASRTGRAIDVPALLLSGTSDPFARIELLEAAMPALRGGTLVTYPKLGHGLKPVQRGRARPDRGVRRLARDG